MAPQVSLTTTRYFPDITCVLQFVLPGLMTNDDVNSFQAMAWQVGYFPHHFCYATHYAFGW